MLLRNAFIVVAVIVLASCRSFVRPQVDKVETNSWVTPKIEVIGIQEVRFDKSLNLSKEFKEKTTSLLVNELNDHGLFVILPNEYLQIQTRQMKKYSPFFDPITGERKQENIRQFHESTIKEYKDKFAPDMLLKVKFFRKEVEYSNMVAKWDNVTDDFQFHPSGITNSGIRPAISFVVKATNLHSNETFTRVQGLQVILPRAGRDTIYDVHPDDFEKHKKNIKLSLVQFGKYPELQNQSSGTKTPLSN